MKNSFLHTSVKFFSLAIILLASSSQIKAQCAANFSITTGAAGSVSLTNTSTGTGSTTMYFYNFGNNTASGPNFNPNANVTYSTNQVYLISLSISDSVNNCFTTNSKTISITNAGCNSSVTISNWQQANGVVNFNSNFNTFGGAYTWGFGDGNFGSGPTPIHTYTASGLYNIQMTVVTPSAVCSYTAIQTISVTVMPCGLTSSFAYTPSANGVVHFASTSVGTSSATSYYWNANGNNYYSPSFTHTFTTNGLFAVSLMVMDSVNTFYCSNSSTQSLTINNAQCPNNTSFTLSKDSTLNLTWNAYPTYPSNISNVTWNWGDGSSSNQMYPSHTYSAAGTYTICLSATVSCGSNTTTCYSSAIYRGADGAMITLHVVNPANPVGLTERQSGALKLFPNPCKGQLFVETAKFTEGTVISLQVYNLLGKVVATENLNADSSRKSSLNLNHLADGIYMVKMNSGGNEFTEKIILQK